MLVGTGQVIKMFLLLASLKYHINPEESIQILHKILTNSLKTSQIPQKPHKSFVTKPPKN